MEQVRKVRKASPAQRRHLAAVRRDGALERLTAITTTIGVVTIVSVGGLGVYVAEALPGHHSNSTTSPAASSGNSGQGINGGGAPSTLNPSSTPTQASPSPAPITSGAS